MKSVSFLLVFFVCFVQSQAQQNHFIYIQTENNQPFYVRIGERLLSSSSVGYIIIPKLQEGNYELNIGFPKNEWPQQKINVAVGNNDAGYVLKFFDARGWGLFNMQTMDIAMAVNNPVTNDSNQSAGKADGFADVLSDVVSTPSIKQKPFVKESPKEKEIIQVKQVNENSANPVNRPEEVKSTVQNAAKSPVKLLSSLDDSGRSIVYVDVMGDAIDTIRILIPYSNAGSAGDKKEPVSQQVTINNPQVKTVEDPKEIIKKTEVPDKDKKFLDMDLENPNAVKDSGTVTKQETVQLKEPLINKQAEPGNPDPKTLVMINSDCKAIASNDDFLKLRKKMAAQKTDENMVVVAKKAYAAKCYTTEQVSNLSALFLNDEGRYSFFDASYPHVNDTQLFSSLVSKLTDTYYINRFQAMIRK